MNTSFSGKRIKQVQNQYNLPFDLSSLPNCRFISMLGEKFVFYAKVIKERAKDIFFTSDATGKVLQEKEIVNYPELFGRVFAENPSDFKKVKNNKLYVLGRKGKSAIVTEISLENLFR
jgi:hypothetical protein